jgi:hypothetical protein
MAELLIYKINPCRNLAQVLPCTIIINNSEVLTAATIKMIVFWDVATLYSLVTSLKLG